MQTMNEKKEWVKPQLEELGVEKTLNGPNFTFVETVVQSTQAPYGYGLS